MKNLQEPVPGPRRFVPVGLIVIASLIGGAVMGWQYADSYFAIVAIPIGLWIGFLMGFAAAWLFLGD